MLGPSGTLRLDPDPHESVGLEPQLARRLINEFERGQGHGLLLLGAARLSDALPPTLAYWRQLGHLYVARLCAETEQDSQRQPRTIAPRSPKTVDHCVRLDLTARFAPGATATAAIVTHRFCNWHAGMELIAPPPRAFLDVGLMVSPSSKPGGRPMAHATVRDRVTPRSLPVEIPELIEGYHS